MLDHQRDKEGGRRRQHVNESEQKHMFIWGDSR